VTATLMTRLPQDTRLKCRSRLTRELLDLCIPKVQKLLKRKLCMIATGLKDDVAIIFSRYLRAMHTRQPWCGR
jgi:hypothetical protein